jgi:hypothetical protein
MEIITQEKNSFNPAGGEPPLLQVFRDSLPGRPYCTDQLGNLQVRQKAQAIKRRYVQQNTPWDLKWLVYDVDRPTAHFDWYDLDAPAPNLTVTNLDNGHAHLIYGLQVPVYKQPEARIKPLHFAASIDVALCDLLRADPGYAGLICKNPLSQNWHTLELCPYLYDLNWLAEYVDLKPFSDRRKHLPAVGLGRNCTLFDVTRRWAYPKRRKEYFLNEEFFVYEVTAYAAERNSEFSVPLPWTEVKATGKSIGRWTWENMTPEGFNKWGDNRRKKSIIVRQTKSQDRADEIKAYKKAQPELSNRKIAKEFNVDEKTVRIALKGMA